MDPYRSQSLGDVELETKINQSYKTMLEIYPLFTEGQRLETVQRWFKLLTRFAPTLASKPIVAGTFVLHYMATPGGISVASIHELIKTESSYQLQLEVLERRNRGA